MESGSPLPRSKYENVTNQVAANNQQTEGPANTTKPAGNAKPSNGLALASLICGGLSFLFGFFSALPAVICGHMALSELKRKPDYYESSSRGMAIAGLVLGYIFLFLTLVMIAVFAVMIAASV